MRARLSLVILISSAAIAFAAFYITYRLVDPLPPRHLVIAAGAPRSGYDKAAKRYAQVLAHNGVELEIRNSAGAVEEFWFPCAALAHGSLAGGTAPHRRTESVRAHSCACHYLEPVVTRLLA